MSQTTNSLSRSRPPPQSIKLLEADGDGMASSWKDVLVLTRIDGRFVFSQHSVATDGDRTPYVRFRSRPFSKPERLVRLLLHPPAEVIERFESIEDADLDRMIARLQRFERTFAHALRAAVHLQRARAVAHEKRDDDRWLREATRLSRAKYPELDPAAALERFRQDLRAQRLWQPR